LIVENLKYGLWENFVKRFLWLVAISLLLIIFAAGCATTDLSSGEATPSPSVIRIGMGAYMPPFELVNVYTGELEGFDVDLIEAIAKETDLEIEIIQSDFTLLPSLVSQCQFDVAISSIPISENLKQQMDFSDPYFVTDHTLVVKEGNIEITGIDTLSGMRVSTQVDSPSELELRKITDIHAETNGTFRAAFQDLVAGYTDAVIADTPRAERYAEIKPYKLKVVGEPFGDTISYGIAVCKERPDVLEKINEGLRIVTENGTLKRLTRKWITNRFQ
jgi:glutamine transport system substrate-binding protein